MSADPLLGRRLTHFTVLERIGSGGMGRVYLARDDRLRREVAIKLLPAGALGDPAARARFEREAHALARLNHPSIAVLHEYDREGDLDFLVLERIDGETLEQRLARGPLPEPEVLALGARIAAALEAAHEQGVVHRDLKPGNVMLTARGEVKVLDFGLAKFLEAGRVASSDEVSRATAIAGTLSYMAPEQLVADAIDARTDVYALGVVLYRMATGRLPFQDQPAVAIAGSILNATPPPPRAFAPGLSAGLEQVILACLEKQPDRRPPSAAAVVDDLARLAAGKAPATPPSIDSLAVLPLENLSGDPAQEYFADGMTDTLIANLAGIAALRVISRTSVMQYKGLRRPLPEIARELRVRAVVEGTVARSDDRVRITARLVDAVADRLLWAHSYERGLGDVLEMQGEVARHIAEEVRARLTPREAARLSRPARVDPRLLELHLHARFFWNQRTPEGIRRAIELFEQAIEVDPAHAPSWSGLADALNIRGLFRLQRADQVFPKARAAARRALEIDPESAEARTAEAFVLHYFDWDWEAAEREFLAALAMQPRYASAVQWYGDLLTSRGRFDEGLTRMRAGRALDPLSPVMALNEPYALYYARRFEEAVRQIREIGVLHPGFVRLNLDLGRSLEALGRFDEAEAAYLAGVSAAREDPAESSALAHLYAARGERERAEAVITRLRALEPGRYLSKYTVASVYACMSDLDRAFEWLEMALEEHDPMMVFLAVHPRLDALRPDPRFAALVRRVGPAR